MKTIHSTCVINGELMLKEKLKKYSNLTIEEQNRLIDGIVENLKSETSTKESKQKVKRK